MSYFQLQCKVCGYKETANYLDGEISKEELVEKIKMESRRYAKRQLTWFRKNKQILWLDGEKKIEENVEIIIKNV